jgi:uncharacterized protein with HEPN domain
MDERALFRLRDMQRSIANMRSLLAGKSFDEMARDAVTQAAFERFLEILSEASRHIPDEWKRQHGADIPWRQIGDLGNVLRHAYHRTDARSLWSVYKDDLGPLADSVERMLEAHDHGDSH